MSPDDGEQKERILALAEDVFKMARNRVPGHWNRLNLTMPQLKVLLSLFVEGPLPGSSLAQAMGVSLPTMNGILNRLTQRGLIVRHMDRTDRRRVLNGLSHRGRELMDRLWTSGLDWFADILDRMSGGERQRVEQALTVLREVLSRQEEYAWTG